MRVLVINCGSSTLKFELIDTAAERAGSAGERRLARGVIEHIGGADHASLHAYVIPVDEAIIIARDTAHCLGA